MGATWNQIKFLVREQDSQDHDDHLIMSGLAYVQMCLLLFLEFK